MTTRTDDTAATHRPIESRADLLSVFESGEKPRDSWGIGTEHEKFVYRLSDHRAPSYEEPGGIRDLLTGLTEFDWRPVIEGGQVIALAGPDGTISLEPAGQLELSGAILSSEHWRIRLGTFACGTSRRLSERKVTCAKCRAISGFVRQKFCVSSSASSGRS